MSGYANTNGKGLGNSNNLFEATHYSHPQRPDEWEMFRTTHDSRPYSYRGDEYEWETQEASHYPHTEMASEWEAEFSFRQALQGIRQVARVTAPFAQHLAPIVARTLLGATPRSGLVSTPMARRFISILLQEGDLETEYLEAEFFGLYAAEAEASDSEAAQEAALTEVLAAEASHSRNPSEASALIGTVVPIAVRSAGGRRRLRSLMPVLIAATAHLVHLLHRRGTAGRRLLRLIPTILRRTIASLRAAPRLGRSITATLVRRVIAAHAARVFGNAQMVRQAMIRNAVIRQRAVAAA